MEIPRCIFTPRHDKPPDIRVHNRWAGGAKNAQNAKRIPREELAGTGRKTLTLVHARVCHFKSAPGTAPALRQAMCKIMEHLLMLPKLQLDARKGTAVSQAEVEKLCAGMVSAHLGAL
jgi:hypothetical protein